MAKEPFNNPLPYEYADRADKFAEHEVVEGIDPAPELRSGHFPYRGTEQHGVQATLEIALPLEDHTDDTPLKPLHIPIADQDPLPVVIVPDPDRQAEKRHRIYNVPLKDTEWVEILSHDRNRESAQILPPNDMLIATDESVSTFMAGLIKGGSSLTISGVRNLYGRFKAAPDALPASDHASGYLANLIVGPQGAAPATVYSPFVHIPPGSTVVVYGTVITLTGTAPTFGLTLNDSSSGTPTGPSDRLVSTAAQTAASKVLRVSSSVGFSEYVRVGLTWGGTITASDIRVDLHITPPSDWVAPSTVAPKEADNNVTVVTEYTVKF